MRRYNGHENDWDDAMDIAVDDSGYVYVTGESYNDATSWDMVTVKYYPDGDTAWVRRYNAPDNFVDVAHAIALDGAGNVYVTGWSPIGHQDEGYITLKYYPDGDTAWLRRYSDGITSTNDYAGDIAVDENGNVSVTGSTSTLKYDTYGNLLWIDTLGGNSIKVDGSGNTYVTSSGWTVKYNPNGTQIWMGQWGGGCVAIDEQNNVYVTGGNYRTIKYYANGDTAWVRDYVGPGGHDSPLGIGVDGSGNVYVTGESYNAGGIGTSYATIKYYPDGTTAWVRRYKNEPIVCGDTPYALAIDGFGNVYVTGYSCDSDKGINYVTLKYYPNGDSAWLMKYSGIKIPQENFNVPRAMTVDRFANVYVTGISDEDYGTIKYVQSLAPVLRGDVNGDSKITISDVVFTINYLFKSGSSPDPIQSGDTNCDGKVSVSDVVFLINYLFKGGPSPAC